jgi:Chromo (CHRromatin Organisation MOdifier) domain
MSEPSLPNTIPNRVQPPPSQVVIDSKPKFEVSKILDANIDNRRKKCKLLYLVRWMGYEGTDKETSWILTTKLGHNSELVRDFHTSFPGKPGLLAT